MKLFISSLTFSILLLTLQNSYCQLSLVAESGCNYFNNFDDVGIVGPFGNGTCGGTLVPSGGLNVSHGTPRPVPNTCETDGQSPTQGILMGINGGAASNNQPNTCGEGIFINFNFKQDKFYTISFGTNVPTQIFQPNLTLFRLNFVAANNLTNLGSTDCDNDGDQCENFAPIITGPNRQVMTPPIPFNLLSTSATCTFTTIQYTPNGDYSQLLIFPDHIGTTGNSGTSIIIDNICIREYCQQNNAIVFSNTSAPFPSGVQKYVTIETNSLGNPGFVTNNPNMSTTFIGGQNVHFKSNTYLSVNSGSYFHAYIEPCTIFNPPPIMSSSENEERGNDKKSAPLNGNLESDLAIVPNPNDGNFQLSIPEITISTSREVKIRIYSTTGQEVLSRQIFEQKTYLNISESSSLQNGIYFIALIVDGEKVCTKKFVVSKI